MAADNHEKRTGMEIVQYKMRSGRKFKVTVIIVAVVVIVII